MSLKTPPQKEKTKVKKTAKSKSISRPKVIKFGQQAGLNKGVSHAIKKPKIKKPEKEKPSKSAPGTWLGKKKFRNNFDASDSNTDDENLRSVAKKTKLASKKSLNQ